MQQSVTASFRQTGCWCRTLRRLKAAAEHGQRPAMAERFCGKDHAGVYSSGTARAAPVSTDYAARRVPSDLNEPIPADYLSASGPRRGQLCRAQNIPIWSSRSGRYPGQPERRWWGSSGVPA